MVSSLAAQLAQGASLNSSLLSQRKKIRESYLFTGRDADQHDLESLHALGVNGFIQLSSLNPALRMYQEALFGYAAKGTDRTLLSAESNAELNKCIAGILRMIGPYLMEPPTQKVIEWLVRRFRYVGISRIQSTF
jgi:U3 small nucleolar RNA-associated protein 10